MASCSSWSCPYKFAAQLNRIAIWLNKSELYDVFVRVDCGDRQTLHQSSARASGDIEKVELARLSVRRHPAFEASPIICIAKMGREQTIPFHVEHSDLMFWRATTIRIRFMQNCSTTGCDANGDVDRNAHNRALPRTSQGFHFFKRLLSV